MASAETRAAHAVRCCFNRDFGIPPNSSDQPFSDSKSLESDWTQINSVNDEATSGCMPHDRNSDKLPTMKWWLHVKTNLGGEANYTCQHLDSWESELDTICSRFIDDSIKIGGFQSVKSFDTLSSIGRPNSAVEHPWNVSPKYMTKNQDTELPKIEAARKNDLHLKPKEKDQGCFWFTDDRFVDSDTDFLVSEQRKRISPALDPQWMGAEKTRPWWCIAGKDELTSLISQKSLEETENFDLSLHHIQHCSDNRPSLYTKVVDHDKNLPSSFDQKAKMASSISNSYTSRTMTSGCSFHDSDRVLSSSQRKDSDSCSKDDQTTERNCKDELLKALCRSQTRAREAEIAAQQAYNEKEHIMTLFFRQASQLFAFKQWLYVLQLENLCLQLKNKNQPLSNRFTAAFPYRKKLIKKSHHRDGKRNISRRRCGIRKCAFAFALGFGLASAGFFLGWTMGWMFPPLQTMKQWRPDGLRRECEVDFGEQGKVCKVEISRYKYRLRIIGQNDLETHPSD